MIVDGIKITHEGFNPDCGELQNYVDFVKARVDGKIESIHVKLCNLGYVDASYTAHATPFERIRRITGYLTGTLDIWNDSKQAEEKDRVKHL